MRESNLELKDTLKIGAVARLTGLSSHTLRKWESCYGAVVPARTERGQRLYAYSDIERLLLIKRLVETGVAPRDVASLELTDLAQRCKQLSRALRIADSGGVQPLRVIVVGNASAPLLARQPPAGAALEIVASASTASELDPTRFGGPVGALTYECDSVRGDTRRAVDELIKLVGVKAAVVVYRFGARSDLLSLQAAHLATMRAPTDIDTLEQVLVTLVQTHGSWLTSTEVAAHGPAKVSDVPPPQLAREVVAKIAKMTPRVRCECPQHLADILLVLRTFEQYSEQCESLNPEDGALHHFLWRSTAQARALVEDAIEHVAGAEGIRLEE
ncbi:MAG: hypothetical protein ACI8W7_005077 [Gammaproteobacteria bacterium]|jgi:hypothetical protein